MRRETRVRFSLGALDYASTDSGWNLTYEYQDGGANKGQPKKRKPAMTAILAKISFALIGHEIRISLR